MGGPTPPMAPPPPPKSCNRVISSQDADFCNDGSLTSGFTSSEEACKERCEADAHCNWYSYWNTGWCRTTAPCSSPGQQPQYRIDIVSCMNPTSMQTKSIL